MSMMFTPGSAAVRSLPSISDGTISFDLYIEDVSRAKFELELETSHGPHYGTAAPIAFKVNGNNISILGGDTLSGTLKNGWNHIVFTLNMTEETPSATLTVNGGEEFAVPVNAEIGDYVCYVHIVCQGTLTYYLDSFLVHDTDKTTAPTVRALSADAPSTDGTDDTSDTDKAPATDDTADDTDSDNFPMIYIVIGAVAIALLAGVILLNLKSKKKSA
jgi:hypothetical protein